MMGHRERLVDGAEYDAFSRRARKLHTARAGQRKAIKRKFNKRARRLARQEVRS